MALVLLKNSRQPFFHETELTPLQLQGGAEERERSDLPSNKEIIVEV